MAVKPFAGTLKIETERLNILDYLPAPVYPMINKGEATLEFKEDGSVTVNIRMSAEEWYNQLKHKAENTTGC